MHGDKIYSVEGFNAHKEPCPAIRISDTTLKKYVVYATFEDYGNNAEPELIDFDGDICIDCDGYGNVYELELKNSFMEEGEKL